MVLCFAGTMVELTQGMVSNATKEKMKNVNSGSAFSQSVNKNSFETDEAKDEPAKNISMHQVEITNEGNYYSTYCHFGK